MHDDAAGPPRRPTQRIRAIPPPAGATRASLLAAIRELASADRELSARVPRDVEQLSDEALRELLDRLRA